MFGGGSFGTAMGVVLARNGHIVTILSRNPSIVESINKSHSNPTFFPPEITMMTSIQINAIADSDPNLPHVLSDAEFIVHSIPVQGSRDYLKTVAPHVKKTTPIISVSKGLELTTLQRLDEIFPQALDPEQPTAFLSGPSFAKELLERQPTAVVIASRDQHLAETFQRLFASKWLRVYTASDVVGVEVGGALKNVIAIAAGIAEGLGLGMNSMAALVTRGCSEMKRLAMAMGARPETLAGLSGIGDLMLTCFGSLSRNRTVGVRLGKGETIQQILDSTAEVAEGVPTSAATVQLTEKLGLNLPIFKVVNDVVKGELEPRRAVEILMTLPLGEED